MSQKWLNLCLEMLNNLKTSVIKHVFNYLHLKMCRCENVHVKQKQKCMDSYVFTKHNTDIIIERLILYALKFDIYVAYTLTPFTHQDQLRECEYMTVAGTAFLNVS